MLKAIAGIFSAGIVASILGGLTTRPRYHLVAAYAVLGGAGAIWFAIALMVVYALTS